MIQPRILGVDSKSVDCVEDCIIYLSLATMYLILIRKFKILPFWLDKLKVRIVLPNSSLPLVATIHTILLMFQPKQKLDRLIHD